jgi:hypothetical protein
VRLVPDILWTGPRVDNRDFAGLEHLISELALNDHCRPIIL